MIIGHNLIHHYTTLVSGIRQVPYFWEIIRGPILDSSGTISMLQLQYLSPAQSVSDYKTSLENLTGFSVSMTVSYNFPGDSIVASLILSSVDKCC